MEDHKGGLAVYLLGPPILKSNDSPVKIGRRKALALLIYLVVTGQTHSRDALATLFWPQHGQSQARANLRRSLSALNQALGKGILLTEQETVSLKTAKTLWVDVLEFHGLIEGCSTHGHSTEEICSECIPPLEQAAALYHNDFLFGFSLPDCREFDEWQFFQGEQLRGELAAVLGRLVRYYRDRNRYEQAIPIARRWLALDPMEESTHRELIRLYALNGQKSAALRQYEECGRVLKLELGLDPSAETNKLNKAIKENRLTTVDNTEQEGGISGLPNIAETITEVDEEIRLITVVFSGPCAYGEEEDGQLSEDRIRQVNHVTRGSADIFEDYGARVESSFGDDTMAVFGITVVHEDDAERAARAALDVRLISRDIGLAVSTGIFTGVAYVATKTHQPYAEADVTGPVANRAVQLRHQAGEGEILVGELTHRQSWGAIRYIPVSVELRGAGKSITAYSAQEVKNLSRRTHGIEGLQAELIGRDEPLDKLKKAAVEVLQGKGRMVSIIGEAGIGKSRLVAELREDDLVKGSDLIWLEGRCQELGISASYWPFLDMLRSCFGWGPEDDNPRRAKSLLGFLHQMGEDAYLSQAQIEEIGPLFGSLLSVQFGNEWDERLKNADPKQIRYRTFQAIRSFLVVLSKKKPLFLILEDLHWADTLSLDLIALLMETLGTRAILLLCAYRPYSGHKSESLRTQASRTCPECYTELSLEELKPQESRAMVESLLHIEQLAPSVKRLVLAKSQGNPFFLEEVVRSLIDNEVICKEGDRWVTRREVQSVPAPEDVRSVIQSRVDRLGSDLKQTLQIASVIGPLFRKRILGQVLTPEMNLDSILRSLESSALIYEERSFPEQQYAFKHVLVQETVYQTITQARKIELHGHVAEVMENLFRDNLEEYSEQLAFHYDRSTNNQKAVAYLLEAGEKARHQFLNEEAINYFQRALERLRQPEFSGNVGDWIFKTLKSLGHTYEAAGLVDEMVGTYREAIDLGRKMNLSGRELVIMFHGLGTGLDLLCKTEELKEITEEGFKLIDEDSEILEVALMNSLKALSIDPTMQAIGSDERRIESYLRNARFLQNLPYSEELAWPYINVARSYTLLRRPEETDRWLEVLTQKAEVNHDLRALGLLQKDLGYIVCYYRGNLAQAIIHLREALRIFRKIGDENETGYSLSLLGWMFEWCGDLLRAEACARQALPSIELSGNTTLMADTRRNIATALTCGGTPEDGVNLLREALSLYRQMNPQVLIHGLIPAANALLVLDCRDEAIELFLEALEAMSSVEGGETPVEEWRMYWARALGGLAEALADPVTLREQANRILRERSKTYNLIPRQWYLEAARPNVTASAVLEEQFNTSLSSDWTWEDPMGGCRYEVGNGLDIYAANGRSLWGVSLGAPRLLMRVSGSFICQTVCIPASNTIPTIGGLVLWKDRDNFLCLERGKFGKHDIILKGCLGNRNVFCGRGRLPRTRIFLRLERSSELIRALCSSDGEDWFQVGQAEFLIEDPVEIGPFASGWIDRTIYHGAYPEGSAIRFESFQLWKE